MKESSEAAVLIEQNHYYFLFDGVYVLGLDALGVYLMKPMLIRIET